MKSKLQKKEIFIPLAAGADTGTDPRVPQSPVAECENVEFRTGGVVVKREALSPLAGNSTTGVAADLPEGYNTYPVASGGVVALMSTFRPSLSGEYTNDGYDFAYKSTPGSILVPGLVKYGDRGILRKGYQSSSSPSLWCAFARCDGAGNAYGGNESLYLIQRQYETWFRSSSLGYGDVEAVGENTGTEYDFGSVEGIPFSAGGINGKGYAIDFAVNRIGGSPPYDYDYYAHIHHLNGNAWSTSSEISLGRSSGPVPGSNPSIVVMGASNQFAAACYITTNSTGTDARRLGCTVFDLTSNTEAGSALVDHVSLSAFSRHHAFKLRNFVGDGDVSSPYLAHVAYAELNATHDLLSATVYSVDLNTGVPSILATNTEAIEVNGSGRYISGHTDLISNTAPTIGILYCTGDANAIPETFLTTVAVNYSAGTLEFSGTHTLLSCGDVPISEVSHAPVYSGVSNVDSDALARRYFSVFCGGRWWDAARRTDFDLSSGQSLVLAKQMGYQISGGAYRDARTDAVVGVLPGATQLLTGSTPNNMLWLDSAAPVSSMSDYSPFGFMYNVLGGKLDLSGETKMCCFSRYARDYTYPYGTYNGVTRHALRALKHGESISVQAGDRTMITGSRPMVYAGGQPTSQGFLVYPEGLTVGANTTTNWTVNGTIYVCCTYFRRDGVGGAMESAPSPSIALTAVDGDYMPLVLCPTPHHDSHFGDQSIRLYQTEPDGNQFFLARTVAVSRAESLNGEVNMRPDEDASFIASGLSSLVLSPALYTISGELENVYAAPHIAATMHDGRYFYSPTGTSSVRYSKSIRPGVAMEFSDVLEIQFPSHGGGIRALASYGGTLYAVKSGSVFACYGDPLNDYGAGQGYAMPRLVVDGRGVSSATQCAETPIGVVMVDQGGIFVISSDGVQEIGGPVRHYTDTYTYEIVFYDKRAQSVVVCPSSSGAPSLSFDISTRRWSSMTGHWSGPIRNAFSANVGGVRTPVVCQAQLPAAIGGNAGYVGGSIIPYVINGNVASVDNYNLSITTPWISLNDTAGYGRFYGWTLLGSKTGAALTLSLNTAYDYEPHWVDSQTYNADALTAFSSANQFSMNSSNTVIDNALKIGVDGSRHKTDAVRLKISDTNGLSRNNIEIVGARLEIGVKPGMTRLGSGRKV